MGLDPKSAEDRAKIDTATTRAHKDNEFNRRKRADFINAFVPQDLNREYAAAETIVPLMYQAIETEVSELVAQNPRVTSETEFNELKSFARRRGLMLNKRIEEIEYACTLRDTVYDAEFLYGVQEVHNGESYPLDFGEYGSFDPGLPTVAHVPFDDHFYDTSARRECDMRFEGKYFRADLESLLEDPNITDEVKKALPKEFTAETNRDGATRTGVQAQGEGRTADLLSPGVDLKTIYLCKERLVVTMVVDRPDLPCIRVVKWKDPSGPYHKLRLGKIPDQISGLSPAAVLYVLHNLTNDIWRKNREQSATQRNVTGYTGAAEGDAQRLKDSRNNQFIKLTHLDGVKMFSTMGPDQSIGQFGMSAVNQFDRAASNLPARAGLGPSTDTVGQDQMILGAATALQGRKIELVMEYVQKVFSSLANLLDADAFYDRELFYETPNKTMRIPYHWKPGQREGSPDQYTVQIVPYSTMYVNPSAKFQGVTNYLQQTLLPALPFAQMLDLGELNEMAAEYLGEPRLRDIFKGVAMPPSDPNNFAGEMGVTGMADAPKAGKPNGEYTRRNVRAPGSDGYADKQVQAAMLGGKPQMNGAMQSGVKQL